MEVKHEFMKRLIAYNYFKKKLRLKSMHIQFTPDGQRIVCAHTTSRVGGEIRNSHCLQSCTTLVA